jgi:hypothetical protein
LHYRAAAVLMAALPLMACSQASPTAPTSPAAPSGPASIRLSGRLVDYSSGRGLAATTINWGSFNGDGAGTSTVSVTDAGGRFDVFLPAAARYTYSLPSGNTSLGSGVLRVPWKRQEGDLLANGGPCAARYGYVFDAVTREPIAGARVLRAGTAFTDATGYYRIDIGCEPHDALYWGIGTTTISASHPAYAGAAELDGRRESTSFSGVRRVDFALQPLQ